MSVSIYTCTQAEESRKPEAKEAWVKKAAR